MAATMRGEAALTDPEALFDALIAEMPARQQHSLSGLEVELFPTGAAMLALDRESQARLLTAILARLIEYDRRLNEVRVGAHYQGYSSTPHWRNDLWMARQLAEIALRGLLRREPPADDETLGALLDWCVPSGISNPQWYPLSDIATIVERRAADGPIGDSLTRPVMLAITRLRKRVREPFCVKTASRLEAALIGRPIAQLGPGEAWSDAALADLDAMEPIRRRAWAILLASCQSSGRGKPTPKWRKDVEPLLDVVGRHDFKTRLLRWLPLVNRPRTQPKLRQNERDPHGDDLIEPAHVDLLKGLAWCAGLAEDRDLARVLAGLALSAYRKVPGKGPRLPSIGHAAVTALGMMSGADALGQLALLKVKVKFIPAQKEIEKALSVTSARENLPREQINELAVPAYGMGEVGRRREIMGDYAVELVVEGQDAELRWSKAADGKPLKSVPAAVRKEHSGEVKELQGAVKDIGKMLTAQCERIDGLFLTKPRWSFHAWSGRYLDHPLVGVIARRLLWRFTTDGHGVDGILHEGSLVGVDDRPLEGLNRTTTVELWHPIGRSVEEILAWRDWLDRHQVRQPFKQAHREVYLLTDAERTTRIYSNRFAAHVLRQHQYHSLCAARGWRNTLRLLVDSTYPPTSKDLPEWGLRAEFWVEGLSDRYGRDTTESGAYRYLSTDQVRFYEIGSSRRHAHATGGGYVPPPDRADAEPVPLERVPPLVLSEILRDVDLFVGVGSIGNDPAWADGGPDGRHVDYWNRYSFGDLSANGRTRKIVLERLIPRLKIASHCSFTEKFLVVRGDLRIYKIHLGSGNILMEPNDQYLCNVAKRGGGESKGASGVFLPFEGDHTLSIILSKALMLADDVRITDPTILSQIRR